ncbi:MAG TPA: heavy metal-binding domain-containing protein [Solirubrobacteraceae bacterium]|nr:heavy metal-binding domain-containing protein [Solirubrobacteraceae bacterium]
MTQDPPEDAADPRGAHDAEPDPPDAPDAEPDPPDAPDAEAGETFDAEERESVKRVEAGGIPVAAERRLRELGEGAGAFTSDLEVSDFALCHQLGLRPLAQVMGSSIYQVGYQGMEWGSMWGGGYGARYGRGIRTGMGGRQMFELQVLSEAWNEARRRALNRLAEEAGHVGADAVVGVDLNTGAHDWAENSIEYMVVGTAVRRGDGRRPGGGNGAARGAPVLTELTLADYANLDRAGIEALGIVAWSSVFFVAASYNTQAMSGGLGGLSIAGFENQELPEFTQGIYSARESVISQMTAQAQQLSASGVIGTRIDHGIKRIEGDGERNRPPGLIATFHAIGTAIRERGGVPLYPPETTVSLTT